MAIRYPKALIKGRISSVKGIGWLIEHSKEIFKFRSYRTSENSSCIRLLAFNSACDMIFSAVFDDHGERDKVLKRRIFKGLDIEFYGCDNQFLVKGKC